MRGSASRRDVLRICEEVIKTYNPKRVTLESHVDEYFASWRGQQQSHGAWSVSASADSSFIRQVFYGVMRYKAALKAFMTCFFNDMMARVVRSDYTMYMILAYLCIFHLEETTLVEFRKFAFAIEDPDKPILFLEYVFEEIKEDSELVAHWVRIFDADHVHDRLLGGLASHRKDAEDLIFELDAKSKGIVLKKSSEDKRLDGSKDRKKATVPNPPKITKPNPRRVPEPKMIRNRPRRQGCSNGNEERPGTPCDGEEEEGRVSSSRTATKPNRSPHLHQAREEKKKMIEREMEEKVADTIDFERRFRKKAPPAPTATVRLNTAAILREESLFRQQQEQEAKAMRDFEIELRDSSEFNRWQADMKSRDLQKRQDQVVRTRILAKASAEDAAVAKANKLLDNRQLAEQVFEESSAMREQRRLESEMALEKNRHQALEVRHVRDTAPKKAVEQVVQAKHEIRKEVRDDLAGRLARKQEEEEKRTAQIAERVRRLKEEELAKVAAAESSPSFDPSSSAGIGLLDEMSMIEMQARLKVNRVRDAERCEKKRDEIVNAKIAHRESIADKVETIRQVREFASLKNRQARQQQAARDAALKERARKTEEELLLRLVDDAATKRAEIQERRAQLAHEEEQQAKKNMFLGTDVAVREQRNATELLKAAERAARDNQKKAVETALLYEATKKKERRQHELNKSRVVQSRRRENVSRDKAVKEAREITTQVEKAEIAEKKRMYRQERDRARERCCSPRT